MDLPILEFTDSSKLCMIPFPVTFKTRLYFLFALLSRLLRDSLSCILSVAHPLLSCHTVLLPLQLCMEARPGLSIHPLQNLDA